MKRIVVNDFDEINTFYFFGIHSYLKYIACSSYSDNKLEQYVRVSTLYFSYIILLEIAYILIALIWL